MTRNLTVTLMELQSSVEFRDGGTIVSAGLINQPFTAEQLDNLLGLYQMELKGDASQWQERSSRENKCSKVG